MKHRNYLAAFAAVLVLTTCSSMALAAPYASGITVSGTTVDFILNQDADSLTYSINGGSPIAVPTGTAKGSHSFTLNSPTDTFSIVAEKSEVGFTTPDGNTYARLASGVPYNVPSFTGTLTSDLANPLTKFNSPRGVGVSNDPNAPNFGAVYVSNSAAGTAAGRPLTGKGLYVLNADQTQAYSNIITDSNAAQQDPLFGATTNANTPYKLTVGKGGDVFVAGFADALSGVWRMSPDLQTNSQVLAGTTGPTPLPSGQNHGSVTSTYVEGSVATNDLVLYTIDEDLTTAQVTGSGSTTDNNKLWRYTVGGTASEYAGMPTAVASPLIGEGFSIVNDVDRGPDGKFYIAQNRSAPANATGLFVTDASGTVLFNSRLATASAAKYSTPAGDFNHDGTMNAGDYVMWRKGTPDADANGDTVVDAADYNVWRGGNGEAVAFREVGFGDVVNDLYANVFAVAVSPDGKWLATLHNATGVGITPLVDGIPDVANFMALGLLTQTITGRDLAFDAAGNLHIVSSGIAQYLVIAPGGHTQATTSWNGSAYAFNVVTLPSGSGSLGEGTVPEPATLVLLLGGVFALGFRRSRS